MRGMEDLKRVVMILLKNIYRMPSLLIKLRKVNENKISKEEKFQVAQYIMQHTVEASNVKIDVFGKENIPKEDGYIFYPNHQGIFDGFALVYACQKPFSPVIKQELTKVPIVNGIMNTMDPIPMQREDVRQSLKVILEVVERVRRKENCLIFPEGTRSKSSNNLSTFKGGSFKAAIKAKCPIVPVALIDCYRPFEEKSIKPIIVQVHILKPIDYEKYHMKTSTEIADMVKGQIENVIKNNKSATHV